MTGKDKPEQVRDGGRPSEKEEDPRRVGRRLALQFLYQLDVQGGANLGQMKKFLDEYGEDFEARELAEQWIKAVWGNHEKLDKLIEEVSENWDLSRITLVDRSNLRLAVYQLAECPNIPVKAVINEAVELAKEFSTAQAPAFVNGVLDAVRKVVGGKQKNAATEDAEGSENLDTDLH
ncbi:MAG: transcription antitermination factor NusB [Planctomycetes bacterium]|nr:transcription antitermination factor NusB [Planctomycetota bacterium]